MKIADLKGQGLADRLTGTFFADTPYLDKFRSVAETIREADADEAREQSALPLWEVSVAEGAFVRKTVRRAWSVAILLETIAAELMRDEDAREEVLEQVTVTISKARGGE